jgi:MerR family transcriptional regulator, copper efflux regulator
VEVQRDLKSSDGELWEIGETSRLFGVRPSTLRHWEDEGLLTPSRSAGRRRYDRQDRRRIALILTWRETGMLELGHIRAILGDDRRPHGWREVVHTRLAALQEHRRRLEAAEGYLTHLATCPSEHPSITCPYLAGEIDRTLHRITGVSSQHGDETEPDRQCVVCRKPIAETRRGRRRRYCSPACRQRAYRSRTEPRLNRFSR